MGNPGVELNRQIERLFLLDIGALTIGDVITNDRPRSRDRDSCIWKTSWLPVRNIISALIR